MDGGMISSRMDEVIAQDDRHARTCELGTATPLISLVDVLVRTVLCAAANVLRMPSLESRNHPMNEATIVLACYTNGAPDT